MLLLLTFFCFSGCFGVRRPPIHTQILMFSDAKYADMTRQTASDWFRLARRTTDDIESKFMLSINTLDHSGCSQFKPYLCVDTGRIVDTMDSSKSMDLADYFRKIALRMTVLLAIVSNPAHAIDGVLMLDSDVILRRNVVERMERYGTDLVFQRELPCDRVNCVNGGVWWARAHRPNVVAFVSRVWHMMRTLGIPDQDAINVVLDNSPNVTVTYLPVDKYPNGYVYDVNKRLDMSRVHLVHLNWRPFEAKQQDMDKLRLGGRVDAFEYNRTRVCASLASLDSRNLAAVLSCDTSQTCARHLYDQCKIISTH